MSIQNDSSNSTQNPFGNPASIPGTIAGQATNAAQGALGALGGLAGGGLDPGAIAGQATNAAQGALGALGGLAGGGLDPGAIAGQATNAAQGALGALGGLAGGGLDPGAIAGQLGDAAQGALGGLGGLAGGALDPGAIANQAIDMGQGILNGVNPFGNSIPGQIGGQLLNQGIDAIQGVIGKKPPVNPSDLKKEAQDKIEQVLPKPPKGKPPVTPADQKPPQEKAEKTEEKKPEPPVEGGDGDAKKPKWTQRGRLVKVKTVLADPDALIVRELHGFEAVSNLFKYDAAMYSENKEIKFNELINTPATLRIRLDGDDDDHGKPKDRHINGVITDFAQQHTTAKFTHYTMTVRPRFWLLTQSVDCKIFQDMTVPDIIEKVLKDHGINEFELVLSRENYKMREYCVQYRESAFNFLSRLMEEEGIFYYFTHTIDRHTMIIGDKQSQFRICPDQPTANYSRVSQGNEASSTMYPDIVTDFIVERQLRPASFTLRDYNFMEPSKKPQATSVPKQAESGEPTATAVPGATPREIYDYPGEFTGGPEPQREGYFDFEAEAKRYAELRKEEDHDSQRTIAHGVSDCRAFVTGHKFTLTGHDRPSFNTEYVLTSLETHAYQSDIFNEPGSYCRNEFTALKSNVPFRPQRITPVPVVHGSQTAEVVGPPGEEIHTDKYGRVKVQFHWDRYGQYNENSSCWLRVGTPWAGINWGYIQLPRIGHEVIVDFLEGDPDKPYVTGSLYNNTNMPPYSLDSANTTSKEGNYKTVSTRKSRSSLKGTKENYNEVRFEDLKDNEQLFIHAERDQDNYVKRDSREHVRRDRHLVVDNNQIEQVLQNKHGHVGMDKTLEVGGRRSAVIGSIDAVQAGTEIHLNAGNKIVLEAGSSITLKVGGSFIRLTPSDIYIKSPNMVYIQDAGGPDSGTSAETGPKPDHADSGQFFGPSPNGGQNPNPSPSPSPSPEPISGPEPTPEPPSPQPDPKPGPSTGPGTGSGSNSIPNPVPEQASPIANPVPNQMSPIPNPTPSQAVI